MLKFIFSKIKTNTALKKIKAIQANQGQKDQPSVKLLRSLDKNLTIFKEVLGESNDIITREFICGQTQMKAVLIYVDGLTNVAVINENIMKPLMYDSKLTDSKNEAKIKNINDFKEIMLSAGDVKDSDAFDELINGCMSGDSVLLIDGFSSGLIISSRGWDMRAVETPQTGSVVRGPREGFTENMRTNTALIRRKIKDPALKLEVLKIGRKTQTNVCIAHIEGVANPGLIKEVKDRISKIDTDAILESGYIEQYIEDAPFSIFATIGYSEKPDVIASRLLSGAVAIIVDGTPIVLTAPLLFIENFQTSEDYYMRPYFASVLRLLRILSFAISVLAPPVYVALVSFHQELIPTPLLFTMAKAMEGTPFPAVIEAAVMLLTYEILREAGIRLPKPIGQAISIVGALVMGQSAVSAGLVGAPMVIVVAITAVSSFVVPDQADSGAIMRWLLLILAGAMGGFGITMGLLIVLIHLASLESFGMPYLSPLAPMRPADLKDSVIRAPLWLMKTRPTGMARQNPTRQKDNTPSKIKNPTK